MYDDPLQTGLRTIAGVGMLRVHHFQSGQHRESITLPVVKNTSSNHIERLWQQRLRHGTRSGSTSLNKRQIVAWATSTDNEIIDRQDKSSSDEDEETDYVVVGSGIGGRLRLKRFNASLCI